MRSLGIPYPGPLPVDGQPEWLIGSSYPGDVMNAPWPVMLMARELDLGGSERQLTEVVRCLDRSRFEPYGGCFRRSGMK